MNVWVTGAHGMLGREITAELTRRGVRWLGTDREVDIADPAAVGHVLDAHAPTAIVNCAAYTAVDAAETDVESAQRVNELGPAVLGQAARAAGATLLHLSTDYVFDGRGTRPYREDDAPAPVGVYARSKLAGEERLRELDGLACFIVRTSWLFGRQGKNFVETMLALGATRETLRVVDDQHGRPTYAPDLALALLDLAGLVVAPPGLPPGECPTAPPGTYHFANTGAVTWYGFTCRIIDRARELGRPIVTRSVEPVTTAEFPRPAPRPAWSVLDTTKITHALGREPRAWQLALDDYLAEG